MKNSLLLGSDHGGYALKQAVKAHLDERGLPYTDLGCGGEPVDYPDVAHALCERIASGEASRGILFCGTGIGMSMAANRHSGVRAAVCSDAFSAEFTRRHNDANVLCLGGRVVGEGLGIMLCDIFLSTPFDGDRHINRIAKIDF